MLALRKQQAQHLADDKSYYAATGKHLNGSEITIPTSKLPEQSWVRADGTDKAFPLHVGRLADWGKIAPMASVETATHSLGAVGSRSTSTPPQQMPFIPRMASQ
ncbi:MAG: hypothetical protein LBU65_03080 [Planctomycetaceae bacterium]|nr:hypothetical protein [Planctomycetaceae bacterium]